MLVSKVIIAAYVLTASLSLLILKWGTNSGLPVSYVNSKLHFNLNAYTVAGLTLYGLSFILYVYLISKYELGYIIPLAAGFVYILIFVGSFFIFKESFTAIKILAITLILFGIVLLNLDK